MSDLGELKRFEADLKKSEELRKRLDEAVRRIADEGKAESDGEVMVSAAAELGYNIALADLERARAEGEDMDDAELELVSGGEEWPGYSEEDLAEKNDYYRSSWCLFAYYCYAAMLHSESKFNTMACWSDYNCIFVHHH